MDVLTWTVNISLMLWQLHVLAKTQRPNPLRQHDETNSNKQPRKGPVTNFIFHKLHKTGSEETAQHMHRFCLRANLRCLMYLSCGERPHPLDYCFVNASQSANKDWAVMYDHFTFTRLEAGCCQRNWNRFKTLGINGIVDHFHLGSDGAWDLLRTYTKPNAVRFTILRDPINQFLSFWAMFFVKGPKTIEEIYAQLDQAINSYWNITLIVGGKTLPSKLGEFAMFTNSQSRELGWDESKPLNRTFRYLESLSFVGLTEHLPTTWQHLRHLLNWQHSFHNMRNELRETTAVKLRKRLTKVQLAKIQEIQWADMRLYEFGKRLFEKQTKKRV